MTTQAAPRFYADKFADHRKLDLDLDTGAWIEIKRVPIQNEYPILDREFHPFATAPESDGCVATIKTSYCRSLRVWFAQIIDNYGVEHHDSSDFISVPLTGPKRGAWETRKDAIAAAAEHYTSLKEAQR